MRVADDWYLLLEMTLASRTRAAFTTLPLWLKRTDGDNRYDGQSLAHVIRDLYFHDHRLFRRDFQPYLSAHENRRLFLRQSGYQAILDCARAVLPAAPTRLEVTLRRRVGI